LRIKFLHKLHSETEEIGQLKYSGLVYVWRRKGGRLLHLCGCIDFGLPSVLTLTEHCSGHELVPVLSAGQLRGFQENSRPIVPREGLPLFLGSKSTVNGIGDGFLVSFVVVAEVSSVIRRNWLFNGLARPDLREKRQNRLVDV
jgi:hypothetical protein